MSLLIGCLVGFAAAHLLRLVRRVPIHETQTWHLPTIGAVTVIGFRYTEFHTLVEVRRIDGRMLTVLPRHLRAGRLLTPTGYALAVEQEQIEQGVAPSPGVG